MLGRRVDLVADAVHVNTTRASGQPAPPGVRGLVLTGPGASYTRVVPSGSQLGVVLRGGGSLHVQLAQIGRRAPTPADLRHRIRWPVASRAGPGSPAAWRAVEQTVAAWIPTMASARISGATGLSGFCVMTGVSSSWALTVDSSRRTQTAGPLDPVVHRVTSYRHGGRTLLSAGCAFSGGGFGFSMSVVGIAQITHGPMVLAFFRSARSWRDSSGVKVFPPEGGAGLP